MLSLGVLSAEQGFDRFGHVRGVGVGNNLIEERNALQPVLPDKSCGFLLRLLSSLPKTGWAMPNWVSQLQ